MAAADACIDAVGSEPHTVASFNSMLDRAKTATFLGTGRPHVLRQGGRGGHLSIVSIIGVYGGFIDEILMGSGDKFLASPSAWRRRRCSTTCRSFFSAIEAGETDPSFVIAHTARPRDVQTFRDKRAAASR